MNWTTISLKGMCKRDNTLVHVLTTAQVADSSPSVGRLNFYLRTNAFRSCDRSQPSFPSRSIAWSYDSYLSRVLKSIKQDSIIYSNTNLHHIFPLKLPVSNSFHDWKLIWLVVWNIWIIFPFSSESSSHLTFIFSRGVAQPPTSFISIVIYIYT